MRLITRANMLEKVKSLLRKIILMDKFLVEVPGNTRWYLLGGEKY